MRAFWEKTGKYVTDRIEIHVDGYVGDAVELQGSKDALKFSHNTITSEGEGFISPYSNRIMRGRLSFFPLMRSGARTLLTEILGLPSSSVRLIWKQDGSVVWTGFVNTEKITIPEHPSGFGEIRAYDFDHLDSIDYPLSTGRSALIEILAGALSYMDLELPIQTRTSWIHEEKAGDPPPFSTDDDFLGYVEADKAALRIYSRTGNESDVPISALEALRSLSGPALIIKQWGGKFVIDQVSEHKNETVLVTNYDKNGLNPTASTVSIRESLSNTADVKVSSGKDIYPGIKRAEFDYDHRSQLNVLQLARPIILSANTTDTTSVENFTTSGDEIFTVHGQVFATFASSDLNPYVEVEISHGSRYWNGTTWAVATDEVRIDLDHWIDNQYRAVISIQTSAAPAQTDQTLGVMVRSAIGADSPFPDASETRYELEFSLENPAPAANSSALRYRLTQGGGYDKTLNYGRVIFGDGPNAYGRGRLTINGTQTENWQRRGSAAWRSFPENLLKEVLDFQRGHTGKWVLDLNGNVDISKDFVYDSKVLFYVGGSYNGRWSIQCLEVNEVAGSDSFQQLISDFDSTGTSSATGSTPSSGSSNWSSIESKPFSTIGANLEVVSDALKTLDTPSFTQVTLSDPGTATQAVRADRSVLAGNGMAGGGALTSDPTLTLGTPSALTLSTTNGVTAGSHTHSLDLSGRTLTFTGGNGINVDTSAQNLGADRTWALSADVTAPVTITGGSIDLAYTDPFDVVGGDLALKINSPLYLNTGTLDVKEHGSAQSGVINTATQNIYGRKQFQADAQFLGDIVQESGLLWDNANSYIRTDTFTSGFAGSGLEVEYDTAWNMTLDNLTIRERLRVYELIINQIRATNGSLWVSSSAKPESVTAEGTSLDWTSTDPFWTEADAYWFPTYKAVMEDDKFVPFLENDLIRAQRFTGRGTYLVKGNVGAIENGSITVTDNSIQRYFLFSIISDSDVPTDGIELVRIGSLSDTNRQGAIYLTADDDDAPYMDIINDVATHADFNTPAVLKGRIGRLDGVVDSDFPTLDGTQTNLYGVYIDGGFFNNVEVRGQITVLPGGNAATGSDVADGVQESKDYTDSQLSGAVWNETIRSDTAPTTRSGGGSILEGDTWIKTDEGNLPHTYDGRSPFSTDGWIRDYTQIGGGNIVAGSVTADRLTALSATGSQYAGLQAGSGTTRNFFAGATDNSGTGATFYVTAAGALFASSATISGSFTISNPASVRGDLNVADGADVTASNQQDWDWIAGSKPEQNADNTKDHALDISHTGTTAPASPKTGWYWIDTSLTPVVLKRYNGTAWENAATYGSDWSQVIGTGRPADNADVTASNQQDWDWIAGSKPEQNADNTKDHALDISHTGTTAPASPKTGWYWIDTSLTPVVLKRYNGTAWENAATYGSDWSQVIGTGKPADNADVTSAQFSQSLSNIDDGTARARAGLDNSGNVQRIIRGSDLSGTPGAAGIYATATAMGFWNGTSYQSYIENDGSFFFVDGSGDGISFDAGISNFTISSENFSLAAGSGSSAVGLSSSGTWRIWAGNTTASSAPFRVSDAGELTATSGTFGGNLSAAGGTFSGSLSAVTGSFGAVDIAGTLTLAAGGSISGTNLTITSTGALTATGATITGEINATSGSFAGVSISGTLTMGASGVITGTGFTLNDDGLSVDRAIINKITSVTVSGPSSINNANYGDNGVLKVNNNVSGGTNGFAVTGLANGVDGLCLTIISSGVGIVVLNDEDTSSTASNRFDTYDGADVVLNPGRAASLIYDGDISRWRVHTFVT